jgi:hypothetical protein
VAASPWFIACGSMVLADPSSFIIALVERKNERQ